MGAQRRAIGGQVVGDVLAEERPPGLDVRVVLAIVPVAEAADGHELVEQRLVGVERRQVEHSPVAPAFGDRCVDPPGGETVVADHGCCCHRITSFSEPSAPGRGASTDEFSSRGRSS
jgi:hypothetical protein